MGDSDNGQQQQQHHGINRIVPLEFLPGSVNALSQLPLNRSQYEQLSERCRPLGRDNSVETIRRERPIIRIFGIEINGKAEDPDSWAGVVPENSNHGLILPEIGSVDHCGREGNKAILGDDCVKFECRYCCRVFPTSQALGGHQNAHKRERRRAMTRTQRSPSGSSNYSGKQNGIDVFCRERVPGSSLLSPQCTRDHVVYSTDFIPESCSSNSEGCTDVWGLNSNGHTGRQRCRSHFPWTLRDDHIKSPGSTSNKPLFTDLQQLSSSTEVCLDLQLSSCNRFSTGFHRITMTITWREREHEEQDMIPLNDLGTVRALRDCGLLKYFQLSGMRQQIELLELLVRAWDETIEAFHIKN